MTYLPILHKGTNPIAKKGKSSGTLAAPNEGRRRKRQLRTLSCFATNWAILTITLWAFAWPGQALAWTGKPLAYVTNSDGISVVDTGDNKVVDSIPIRANAAVSPDGKRLYAFGPSTSDFVFNVSVMDTSDDKVVATVPLDVSLVAFGVSLNTNSAAIAVSPDG